jgi:L-alanine-DL-glutamate epimerase-like enolase superfamily enzyme
MQTTLTQVLERLASAITEVAVARHDLPFYEAEWHFALGTTNVERGVFIRIRDAVGNEGLGYAAEVKHDGETVDSLVGALKLLAADLVGHPPYPFTSHLDRWDRLLYRNRRAKAGLEFALLDLAGRALGVPCRLFLGASSGSTSVDVMRILQLQAPEAMAETARQLVREGYRYLKIKVGGDLATDIERVRAVRAAVGSEVGLIVDANQAFTPKEAISFGRAVASAGIDIFEQPVARENVQGLREVRRALDCWIEADESAATSQDVANLAAADAIDCVSIKLPKMGGLLRSIAVAQTCQALGLAYRIGASFGSRLYAAANMQFIAAMPVDYACEVGEFMHLANDPVADIEVRDGRLALPDGPGLGARLRPDTQLDWQVIAQKEG